MTVYRALTFTDYERCAKAGMTAAQAATYLGASHKSVHAMTARRGLHFAPAIVRDHDPDARVKAFSASPAAIAKWEASRCKPR
jgi:hypothetical protein